MPRLFFREGRRLLARAMHLVGSRTVFFVCLLLSITTAFNAARTLWFSRTAPFADGLVVREVEESKADSTSPSSAGTRVYRAIVRFEVPAPSSELPAQVFEVRAQLRSAARLYPVGTKVEVVYPAGAPGQAKLRPELPDNWSQAGVLFMATMLGAGAAYGWWKLARRRVARRRRVVNRADSMVD